MAHQIRVLVADDHELLRCGIVRILSDMDGIDVVGDVESGEKVLEFCRYLSVDIVLMNIRMAGMAGLEVTRRLLARSPEIKVVAFSSMDDPVSARKVMEAGAWGYLSKDESTAEICHCLHMVAAGKRYIGGDIASELAIAALHPSTETNPFACLSPQEFQVASMVMECYRIGDIARVLSIEPKTVNSYRYRIFEKLGVKNDVAMTRLAIQYGIVDSGCVPHEEIALT